MTIKERATLLFRKVAGDLDAMLAATFGQRMGYALLVFDFEEKGFLTYVSNAERQDMIRAVREWLEKVDREGDA